MPNRHLLILLALVSIIATLYQGIFTHTFVAYDDTRIIVNRVKHYNGINKQTLPEIVQEIKTEYAQCLEAWSYEL